MVNPALDSSRGVPIVIRPLFFKCRGKTRNKLLTNLCAYFPLLFSGTCCILCISTFQVPVDDTVQLDKIRKERNYTYEDQVECSREKLPNYDEQVRRNFPHTPFCSRDKLPRKSKVEFPPTPFCSWEKLPNYDEKVRWNFPLHRSYCKWVRGGLFKDWSQFLFGSWRNNLNQVVQTV
jgi:hypothetical protein